MPIVYNKKNLCPKDATYIGRPSIFGNPFEIGRDGTRKEVIQKFEQYLCSNAELMAEVKKLKGKDVVCWCAPLACHGDVIVKHANTDELEFG